MDARLAALARAQAGCFLRGQALSWTSYDVLGRLVAKGDLLDLGGGVLCPAATPATFERGLWVARLGLGEPYAVSGLAAAHLLELPRLAEADVIDVVVPRSRRPGRLVGVRVRRVAPSEFHKGRYVDGHPVQSLELVLRDLARSSGHERAVSWLQDSLRERRTTTARLVAATGRGRSGSPILRGAVDVVEDRHQSRDERRLARGAVARGLPRPRAQVRLLLVDGVCFVDLGWLRYRTVVEVLGPTHLELEQHGADLRRANSLWLEHQLVCLQFTTDQVRHQLDRCLDDIERALRAGGWSPSSRPPHR